MSRSNACIDYAMARKRRIKSNKKNKTAIVMQDKESEENKRLLKKFLDLESEDEIQGGMLHQEE